MFLLIIGWAFGSFPFSACFITEAAMTIHTQTSRWIRFPFSWTNALEHNTGQYSISAASEQLPGCFLEWPHQLVLHQQSLRALASPRSHQYLLPSVLLLAATLVGDSPEM